MSVLRFFLLLILCVCLPVSSFAQSDSIILKIGNEYFTKGEFNFIYSKNNQIAETKKSAPEYLQLFVNYKLKVHEAKAQGLDTLTTFKDELAYYTEELAKPYLTDKNITDELIKEAYNHMEYEVDASHILALIPRNPTPNDTLKAYNKIKAIKEQLNNGADFNELAKAQSEDPSAVNNGGRLGYFGGFMMVYPFEKAAYQTAVGDVSPIVKTQYGYHLIKVHGIRKNRGEIHVAHIMRVFPRNSPQSVIDQVKLTIDTVYNKLMTGAKWEDMVNTYSEDGNSARNGGEMPWFGSGRMIPEFAEPAFSLQKDGDISKPVLTPFGWHIIKRLGAKPIASFEEMKPDLETRIASDERAYSGQKAVVERLKKEYNFIEYKENYDLLASLVINPFIKDSLFYAGETNNSNKLFCFANKCYTVTDFKQFLHNKKGYSLQFGYVAFETNFKEFEEQAILAYEKSCLSQKYPSYNYLISEYHDGLLIFDISKKEIWDKASSDTIGLKTYYNENKTKFISPQQFSGRVFYAADQKSLKQIKPYANSSKTQLDSVVAVLNKEKEVIRYINGPFSEGQNKAVDEQKFKIKSKKEAYKPNLPVVFINGKMLKPAQRSFEEAKGQVISEYQNYLDQQWIKALREKYQPQIGTL